MVLAAFLLFRGSVEAAEPVKLDEAARSQIAHVENYLNGLKSLEARFVQISSNGEFAEGQLYMSWPGKLRIEYDAPKPDLIVADGLWLAHYDKELEQETYVLLNSTPAGILLDEKIALDSEALNIVGYDKSAGVVRISVVRKEDPLEGTVTLVFGLKPLSLKKWTVVDAQGTITTVSLQNPRFGRNLDSSLFHFEFKKAPPVE